MECSGIIWDILKECCKCTAKFNASIRLLEENLNSLSDEKRTLETVIIDVNQRVEREKEDSVPRKEPRKEVLHWLDSAKRKIEEVGSLLQKGEQEKAKLCLGGYCSKNCWSGYNVGKELVKMTVDVQEEIRKGRFVVVADPLRPAAVQKLPKENDIVGIDSRLSDVWRYIEEDGVKKIGLYGIRGVGKTTLLNHLHDKFSDKQFDVVIFVKASTEANIQKIQEVIGSRLWTNQDGDEWKNKDERSRAAEIFRRLSNKKFALLLDDLREEVNLKEVGVPVQDGSKIVFTTIFEEVCRSMSVDRIFKVDYLPQEEAWNLFRLKVSDTVLNSHPEIPSLAKTVANMCGGLPLALITTGSAMAGRKDPDNWRHAIEKLQRNAYEFEDMGTRVFTVLRFSYDRLSEIRKTCFLFCSLFPRNEIIMKDELIELWIGEGILRPSLDIAAARREGKFIIDSLKRACLLDEVEGSEYFIKMHGLLRDMALWIASKEANKILVLETIEGSITEQENASWKETVRLSLWRSSSIESLPPTLPGSCPFLLTLLVRYTGLKEFQNMFQSSRALGVLDLSHNFKLKKFSVGKDELINLRYLNLSNTWIRELSIEMESLSQSLSQRLSQRLSQLRTLLLDGTENLKAIPVGLISSLSSLQVFSWVPTLDARYRSSIPGVTVFLLEELESLKHLQEISVVLLTLDCVSKFKSSTKLKSRIRRLIIGLPRLSSRIDISLSTMTTMSNGGCFKKLQDICIIKCSVKNLTSLLYIPLLRFLFVQDCPSLEEIIGPSEIDDMFIDLKQAYFFELPKLMSICGRALAFPSLERIYVDRCPNLRKLPFNCGSAKEIGVLIGELEWWNQLEWDDEAAHDVFSSKFITIPNGTRFRVSYTYEATIRLSVFLEEDILS